MRLRALLFAGAAFGLTGYGAWQLAGVATDHIETESRERVAEGLSEAGEVWADVETDGLQIVLSGTAPDEAARFRAVELVRRSIDPRRVVDQTKVATPAPVEAPDFSLELLRNDAEISLIGLVPSETAQDIATARMIRDELTQNTPDLGVTDMLETADHPEPKGWSESLDLALHILSTLPRAKISVEPGHVGVFAIADSPEAKDYLERRLRSETPADIELSLNISAPRPIIAPFELVYSHDGTQGHLETCSASDESDVERILEFAQVTDSKDEPVCKVGLGAPSPIWTDLVIAGLSAVQSLGQGRFEIRDTEVVLDGGTGSSVEEFDSISAKLAAALPATFSVEAINPRPMRTDGNASEPEAIVFIAELKENGRVTLEGAVRDNTSRQAIQSYTSALFGHDMVLDETKVNEVVPEGWPGRVLAGIDALHEIKEGRLSVTPTTLDLKGWGIEPSADADVEAMLEERVDRASVEIAFDSEAAAAEAHARELASMSRPEICASEVSAILASQSIEFRPGSAEISPESRGVLAAIADVLRTCPGAQFEVAGHTDSQGREETNLELSRERAEAVRAALEEQDLPLVVFRARGYGAKFPVEDNATEAGRRRNRRIELTLFKDAPKMEVKGSQSDKLPPSACADLVAQLLEQEAIEFDVGASEISPGSQHVIAELADALSQCNESTFEISGHTDSLGRADVNKRISAERAEAVRTALQEAGVPESITLSSRGYGAESPIADNSTREGRALNRRIEMRLLAPTGVEDAETAREVEDAGESAEGTNGSD